MLAGQQDIIIYRGRAQWWPFQLWMDEDRTQPIDLTGCTPLAGITLASGEKLELAAEVFTGELEGIQFTPEKGCIKVSITDEQAALLTGTDYAWMAGVIDTVGDWNPCLEGRAEVRRDSTPT